MLRIAFLVTLSLGLTSANFLTHRDLQAAVNTTSPSGGTWMNGTCSRTAATDSCPTGTCCSQIFMPNGTLGALINATTGLCFPVGFANSGFLVNNISWSIGSCLLPASVTAYAATWNTNVSSCTAGQCAASITYNFGGSNGN